MSRPSFWIKATHLESGRVKVFRSQTSAAEALTVPQACISACILRGDGARSYGFKFERMVPKEFTADDMQHFFQSVGFTEWRTMPAEGYVAMVDGVYLAQNTQIRYDNVTDLGTLFEQWHPHFRKERTWPNFVNHFFLMLAERVYVLEQAMMDEEKECAAILFSFKQHERSVTVPLRVSVVLED